MGAASIALRWSRVCSAKAIWCRVDWNLGDKQEVQHHIFNCPYWQRHNFTDPFLCSLACLRSPAPQRSARFSFNAKVPAMDAFIYVQGPALEIWCRDRKSGGCQEAGHCIVLSSYWHCSSLTKHIMNALPCLRGACHATRDNLMKTRLNASQAGMDFAWLVWIWKIHDRYMATCWAQQKSEWVGFIFCWGQLMLEWLCVWNSICLEFTVILKMEVLA